MFYSAILQERRLLKKNQYIEFYRSRYHLFSIILKIYSSTDVHYHYTKFIRNIKFKCFWVAYKSNLDEKKVIEA